MSWERHHSASEILASAAEVAARRGDSRHATGLYQSAAEAEVRALYEVEPTKTRTLGVTIVSAVALYYKAGELETARGIAQRWLNKDHLPSFACEQLKDILQKIRDDLGDKAELEIAPIDITFRPPTSLSRWATWTAGIAVVPYVTMLSTDLWRSHLARQVTGLDVDLGVPDNPQLIIALCLIAATMALWFLKGGGKILASLLFGVIIAIFYSWAVLTREIKVNTGFAVIPQEGWIGNLFVGAGLIDLIVLILSITLFILNIHSLLRNRRVVGRLRDFNSSTP